MICNNVKIYSVAILFSINLILLFLLNIVTEILGTIWCKNYVLLNFYFILKMQTCPT